MLTEQHRAIATATCFNFVLGGACLVAAALSLDPSRVKKQEGENEQQVVKFAAAALYFLASGVHCASNNRGALLGEFAFRIPLPQ